MALRFRKRIKVIPGVTLNISGKGISTTIGGRGASINIGKNGTFLNTGIPGTGIYSRKKLGKGKAKERNSIDDPEFNIKESSLEYENIGDDYQIDMATTNASHLDIILLPFKKVFSKLWKFTLKWYLILLVVISILSLIGKIFHA